MTTPSGAAPTLPPHLVYAFQRLTDHFQLSTGDAANTKWDDLWKNGDFLPWDKGTYHPALEDTVRNEHLIPAAGHSVSGKRRTALVPGCGGGYDVLLLACLGYDAVGLEVSENALKVCEEQKAERMSHYPKRTNDAASHGSATFICGDFFKDDWRTQVGSDARFDLVWDYTFLCALAPNMRPAWASRMSQLLKPSADSRLVCLEHPLTKDPKTSGPPHGLSEGIYLAHLHDPGQQIPYTAQGWPEPSAIQQQSKGLHRIARFVPQRTHGVGMSTSGDAAGTTVDRVSVWTPYALS